MANVSHASITDPNIHEPKGVATAAANKAYVANGLGSGAWGYPLPKGIDSAAAGQVFVANGTGGGTWQANTPTTPDYGEYYVQSNAVATTIAATNTFVKLTSGVTAGQLDGITLASNDLVVAVSAKYLLEAVVTLFGVAATTIVWELDFLVNGTALGRKQAVTTTGTERVTVDLKAITATLAVSNTLSVAVANTTDTNDPTVVHASFIARQL